MMTFCATAGATSSSTNKNMARSDHKSLNRFFSIETWFSLSWNCLDGLFLLGIGRRQVRFADSPHSSCDADSALRIHPKCGPTVADLPNLPRKQQSVGCHHKIAKEPGVILIKEVEV